MVGHEYMEEKKKVFLYLRKALLVDMIHHYNFMVVTGWRPSRAEEESSTEIRVSRVPKV